MQVGGGVHVKPAGTEVGVNLRVFKVESVDTASSHLKLKVWFRMQWSDLRLAWDPAEFGGITQTQMRAAAITIDQDSDIWLPDMQPYSMQEAQCAGWPFWKI